MIANHIGGYATIDEYVKAKLARYEKEEKNFASLFHYMFDEKDNIMAESSDGYRVKTVTYGKFKEKILAITPTVKAALKDVPAGSMVGLYMGNCMEWIEAFWAILLCGCDPVLMNNRLPDDVLEDIIAQYSVAAVISDGKSFSCPTYFKDDLMVEADVPFVPDQFGTSVYFMSSGTASSVKLCAYTGENFYYQICDSVNIITQCPDIKKHYEGELKQLILLPFYHVFGFIAVYLWFGFFSRTFVFPKDLNPTTIQNTVKKHKVTHIFAVPMVWEAVYKAAMGKIRGRGKNTLRKFNFVSSLVNATGAFGDVLAKLLLREVRDGIFGDSICFLITGGSHIKPEAISFFNGIGYHMANGYGMTEIGITSVEKAKSKRMCNRASIGAPFGYTQYRVGEGNELQVRGKTRADRIMMDGQVTQTDYDSWFSTRDLVRFDQGRYYMMGRSDDLIITQTGENLNPVLAEESLAVPGIDRLCVFGSEGQAILLVSVPGCFSTETLRGVYEKLSAALQEAKLDSAIHTVRFTHESLLEGNDFKVSRKKIARRYREGSIRVFDPRKIDEHIEEILGELEQDVRACFARVLDREEDSIGLSDNFFRDLGGSSIDYFSLLSELKSRFGVELLSTDGDRLATVKEFCDHIKRS